MRLPGFAIIDRYVAREVLAPFAVDVGLLTFALVTGKLLKLMDMVVNHGVSLGEVCGIIGYIMPAFLELTFPMAVLLGVLMGFGRMSSDQEMTAARACGVSLYRLAVPVMFVALGVYAVSSYFAFSLRPWANSNLRNKLYELSQTRTSAGLKEKIFNSNFPGLVVYVDEMSDVDSSLKGVMISDARDPHNQNTIIAKRGALLPDSKNKTITLRLYDGSIFGVEPQNDATHVTSFKTYDLGVSPEDTLGVNEAEPDEMSYSVLRAAIASRVFIAPRANPTTLDAEGPKMASKFTRSRSPRCCSALLGISASGLAKPARGGHSERFGDSVALFFFYYSLMRVGETLAQRGKLNAYAAMSIPDLSCSWRWRSGSSIARRPTRLDQGTQAPGDIIWDLVERYEQ